MKNKSMLIYISGRITNNPNYREEFKEAEEWLKAKGYTPLNTTNLDTALPKLSYEQYMQIDYTLVDIADGIYMLADWQDSKGAKAELSYAKSLGKRVMYQKKYKREEEQ